MEYHELPVDSWLQKEISEFNAEFDSYGDNAPSTLDEALDCFGLVALGADVSEIDSASVGRLCACSLNIFVDDEALNAWQKKQSDRGRGKITNLEIERAVAQVVNRSPILLLVNKIMLKLITADQNG